MSEREAGFSLAALKELMVGALAAINANNAKLFYKATEEVKDKIQAGQIGDSAIGASFAEEVAYLVAARRFCISPNHDKIKLRKRYGQNLLKPAVHA